MAPEPIIRVAGVSKSFGGTADDAAVPVLLGADLELFPGDKASLVGPSGCGKSTLLSLIAGLLRPDAGTIEIDGTAIGELDDGARARVRAERIGIALQADNLVPFLTAVENVELALGFGRRRDRAATRRRAEGLLERFDVGHRGAHRPRHLSGGETQRVALAVAMANEPAVLLADEVVAQLDGETAGRVVDEVLAGDLTVLYVTHDLELADRVEHRFRLCDHRIVRR